MAARCPNGDLPMIAGFLDIRRRPAGPPAVTAGRPADRRRGIGRNFGNPQSESGGHRAVAWRWPADVWFLTFMTRFKVKKIRRSSTDASKQESAENRGDHRTILKACDTAITPSWSIKVTIVAQKFATSITDCKGSDATWELRMY